MMRDYFICFYFDALSIVPFDIDFLELEMRYQFSICLHSMETTREEGRFEKNGILIASKNL